MAEMISITEAAKRLGKSRQYVAGMIQAYEIKTHADPRNLERRLITAQAFSLLKTACSPVVADARS